MPRHTALGTRLRETHLEEQRIDSRCEVRGGLRRLRLGQHRRQLRTAEGLHRRLARHPRVFFFKQKTAYELGLGIPAEPLFRSEKLLLCDLSPSTNDSVKN